MSLHDLDVCLATLIGRPFRNRTWSAIEGESTTNAVFRGQGEGGDVVLKVLSSPRAARAEVRGLTEWGPQAGWRVPRVHAADLDRGFVVMEDLGAQPSAREVTSVETARRAGRRLASLHGLEVVDDDPLPFAEAWRSRVQRGLREAKRVDLDAATRTGVEELVVEAGAMEGVARCPCHRDFRPRNWIRPAGQDDMAVIDFEQSRLDDPLADFVRFFEDEADPRVRDAFREGYGRNWSTADERRFAAHAALHALNTLSWAQRHGDVRFVTAARRRLEELGI